MKSTEPTQKGPNNEKRKLRVSPTDRQQRRYQHRLTGFRDKCNYTLTTGNLKIGVFCRTSGHPPCLLSLMTAVPITPSSPPYSTLPRRNETVSKVGGTQTGCRCNHYTWYGNRSIGALFTTCLLLLLRASSDSGAHNAITASISPNGIRMYTKGGIKYTKKGEAGQGRG